MPIYTYECKKCHQQIQVKQSMTDAKLSICSNQIPKNKTTYSNEPRELELCGGELERIIQKSSFELKGNGWFKQGY